MRRSFLILGLAFLGRAAVAQQPTISHHVATVNGVKLHYAQAGQGELIMFLHGFPEFWYEWKNQLVEFGRDHLAVAPDQRGYNLSDKPGAVEAYQVDQLVEDVRALADQLNGGKPFVLVGHDWGGVVAWAFGIKHPELTRKLVIINAPHPGVFQRLLAADSAQQRASQYMLFFRSPQAEQTLSANNNAALVNIFSDLKQSGRFTADDELAYLAAWNQPGAITGGLNWYRAAKVGPPTPESASTGRIMADNRSLDVTVPTLVIWGEKDTALLTSNLIGLDRYVSNLTVKRIPEGSHWVIHEFPDQINQYVRAFLTAP